MNSHQNEARLVAVNLRRKRLFGDSSLKVYTAKPEAGREAVAKFEKHWFGHRIAGTTDGTGRGSGAWQFQIEALPDWEESQSFMLGVATLSIDVRRWKVNKIEKPIGLSLIWKIRAQEL